MNASAFVPPVGSWAVVFTSRRTGQEDDGYGAMAEAMVLLAAQQPGFIAVRSSRGADGFGLTVSYWDSLEAITAWRAELKHQAARDAGRARWYAQYELQVLRVERAYAWELADGPQDPRA